MSARDLNAVIRDENWIRDLFSRRKIDPRNITIRDAIDLYQKIDSQMSPENLTCDGELSNREIVAKRRKLMGAVEELDRRGFRRPGGLYMI